LLKPADIPEMSEKQLSILQNASNLIKGGGSVVYSTCSLEVEENETVCEKFLSKNTGFSIVKPSVDGRFITDRGFARVFPHRDGMDGFFIAELRRN
jgi:16S rRNA (cytosine967-C5)-methyltransferase